MSGERLFRILGLVDDDLIEEAAAPIPVRRRFPWRRALASAACLAAACGAGLALRMAGSGAGTTTSGDGSAGSGLAWEYGEGAAGDSEPLSVEGLTFMSYAGPVFPLTTAEPDTGLTAERTVTWDFAPGAYDDGSPRQWGAAVTDAYVLTNPTEEDVTVTALYPFAGNFRELAETLPTASVDGAPAGDALYAGAYAGRFQGVWQSDGQGGHQLDGSTWNLESPASWTDYQALLEDGGYLARALEDAPALDIPATVYEFTDFAAPHEEYDAATQAIEFTIDREKTTVLTYGFNGGSWDWDTGWQRLDYFVPDGVHRDTDPKLLVVLGEDIGDYTLQGYADGGCDAGEEIDGVSCTVTRTETTLVEVLDRLCRSYLWDVADFQLGMDAGAVDAVPYGLFRRAVSELMVRYGVLSDAPTDRYGDGRLDDIISETLTQKRVLYLAVPVTVPAGGSVDITFELWKKPSFDYGCSGSENVGLQGYDLVTRLGSALDFTAQTAALVNTDGIEIVRQNLGLDPENGVLEAPLEPDAEHYELVIRPRD